MKRTYALYLLLGILALLGGCKPGSSPKPNGGRLFVISFQTLDNPFFTELNQSLKTAIESNGDRLITLDAQFNSLKQKDDVVDLLLQKPAVLFINPVNWENIKATLVEARRRNIPVIIVDAPVSDRDLVICQVASDNFEAGRLACEELARVKPSAKILIIQHSVNKPSIDRVAGFKAAMQNYSEMGILDTLEGRGSTTGALRALQDSLKQYPTCNALFAINDPSALGSIAALEATGELERVTVVAVDGSRRGVEAIIVGKLHASVAQDPREIGSLAAKQAYTYLSGKPLDKDVKVPVRLITKQNAADILRNN